MTSELKPCFSCNGSARLLKRSFYANKQSRLKSYRERVECRICGLTTREYKKPTAAVHSWNTRSVPDVPELVRLQTYGEGEYVSRDQAAAMLAAEQQKIKDAEELTFRADRFAKKYLRHMRNAEQRAEAAEAQLKAVNAKVAQRDEALRNVMAQRDAAEIELALWGDKIKTLEAELAQIKVQVPVVWRGKFRANSSEFWEYYAHPDSGFDPEKYEQQPLYASPAPLQEGGRE